MKRASCSECGARSRAGFRFCGSCGHRLAAASPPRSAQPRPASRHPAPASPVPAPTTPTTPSAPPTPRRLPVPGLLIAAVAVAAVLAATLLNRAPAPEASSEDAAARGDAARTGTFPDAGTGELGTLRWSTRWTDRSPVEDAPGARPVVTEQGVLVRSTGALALVDPVGGHVRWRSELDVRGTADPLPIDDRLVAVAGLREVSLIDAVDGTRLWRAPVTDLDVVIGMAANGRHLAVGGGNGTTVVLDLARGWQRAAIRARDLLGGRGIFAADVGPVAVGDGFALTLRPRSQATGTLVVVSADGAPAWASEEAVVPQWRPVAGEDRLVVTHPADGLVAHDAESGEIRWRWRSTTGEQPAQLRAVATTPDEDRLLVVSDAPIRRVLDTRTGALIGSDNADPLRSDPIGPPGPSGRVAAVTVGGVLEVIDVASARTVLARPPFGPDDRAVVDGARLVIGLTGGVAAAQPLEPDGSAWRADVAPEAACPVLASDGVIAVGDGGMVRAHDPATGASLWADPDAGPSGVVPDTDGPPGELAAREGVLLAVNRRGVLEAREAEDGSTRWSAPVGVRPLATPVVADDTVLVAGRVGGGLGGSGGAGYLRALDLEDGDRRWFAATDAPPAHPPTVADDRIVVATTAGELESFDVGTGERRWRTTLGSPAAAAPVQRGDRIVVFQDDGELVTLAADPAGAGEPTVLARTTLAFPLRRAPAVTGDAILVRLDSRTLVALDLDTHEPRWRRPVPADVLTTPPTVTGDRVLVGGQRGLHVFDLHDGATTLVEMGALTGAPVPGTTGVVLCGADGRLAVLG